MRSYPDKTLEQLDNEIWPEPEHDSYLVKTTFALRKKRLSEFETEDLRIMIGQHFSLQYLIPLAIKKLNEDILAEGHFYPGDLLKAVLDADQTFWIEHKEEWMAIKILFEKNRQRFESDNTYKQLRKSFEIFEKINK